MTILVTGSSGTVGTALCQKLLNEGYDVRGADVKSNRWSNEVDERTIICDLTDESAAEKLPDSVDLIIHLAANARVHKLVKKPALAQENFDTTFSILEYARDVGADFIFSSSREVYGNNGKIIYDETDTYVDELRTRDIDSGEFLNDVKQCLNLGSIERLLNIDVLYVGCE